MKLPITIDTEIEDDLVDAANDDALGDDTSGAIGDINDLDSDNSTSEVKAALQRLADVTAHEAGEQFSMDKVRDDQLMNYVTGETTGETDGFDGENISNVSEVRTVIEEVNDVIVISEALDIINDTDSDVSEVNSALMEIALVSLEADLGAQEEGERFINLPSQARYEVSGLVQEARVEHGDDWSLDEINRQDAAGSGDGALVDAMDAHEARLDEINDMTVDDGDNGDLADATTSEVRAALEAYDYDAYNDLSTVEKIDAAEWFKDNTTMTDDEEEVARDFSEKPVNTFAEAEEIIDAAIVAVTE